MQIRADTNKKLVQGIRCDVRLLQKHLLAEEKNISLLSTAINRI